MNCYIHNRTVTYVTMHIPHKWAKVNENKMLWFIESHLWFWFVNFDSQKSYFVSQKYASFFVTSVTC